LFIIGVGSFGPSRNPRKGPRSIGSGPAENQHAEVEIRAPREARLDAQPQMTHGVVLKDMVMKRFVPAVAPERGDEGLLPYRAHAYREALETSTSSATTMVVHSSRDTMISFPNTVGSLYTLAWFVPCSGSCARARIATARFGKRARVGLSHDLGRVHAARVDRSATDLLLSHAGLSLRT